MQFLPFQDFTPQLIDESVRVDQYKHACHEEIMNFVRYIKCSKAVLLVQNLQKQNSVVANYILQESLFVKIFLF